MIFEILIFILTFLVFHYVYLLWNKDYWKKRGVFCPQPDLLLGNLPGQVTGKRHISYELDDLYQKYKNDYSYIGIYNFRSPRLLVFDPVIVKYILIKYFKNFQANDFTQKIDKKSDPLFGNHPFFLVGDAWKSKRAELTAVNSSSRIKALFPIFLNCYHRMEAYIKSESMKPDFEAFDAKNLAGRYTMSSVSDSIYSVDAKAFETDECDILTKTNSLLRPDFKFHLNHIVTSVYPFMTNYMKTTFCKPGSLEFFVDLMSNAIKYRVESKIERADYLDYLISLRNKNQITLQDVANHGATFLADGYETSSESIACAIYELGKSKNAQEKLREEILTAMPTTEDITHDKIMDLEYLDHVWNETLRIHPPVTWLTKACNSPVEIEMPDGNLLPFEEFSTIYIPVLSIHLDEQHYENPLKFMPERFDSDHQDIKYYKEKGVYMPFGDGPRICVGSRFATAQSKIAIANLIRNFEVTVNSKTADTFTNHPLAIMTQNDTPYWINFKEIS